MPPNKISIFKQILFTVITWAVILLAINGVCGLIVQNRYISIDPITKKNTETSYGYWTPNQDKILLFPGIKEHSVRINPLGFRTTGNDQHLTIDDLKDKYTILCLGDSMTFGSMVPNEASYPYQLQQKLTKHNKNAIVLNAGIGGSTISDYLHYLKLKGLKLKPNLVAINFYSNDIDNIITWKKPIYERQLDDSTLSISEKFKLANFMRVGRKLELAYRYKRSINKLHDERLKSILLEEKTGLEDILHADFAKGQKILANPYDEELRPYWDEYLKQLDETVKLLKDNHIDFIFLIYPDIYTVFDRGHGNYQEILRAHCDKNNIEYIDMRPIFQEKKEDYLKLYNQPPRDFHMSGYGKSLLVDELFERIKNRIH